MDCPCLLGRTLNSLMALSMNPQRCQLFLFVCLSVRPPAFLTHLQHFTSLSLHASVLQPPLTPILHPPALLKTLHFMSLAPPRAPSSVGQGSGHPSAQTGGTACLYLACAVCDPHQACCDFLFVTVTVTQC